MIDDATREARWRALARLRWGGATRADRNIVVDAPDPSRARTAHALALASRDAEDEAIRWEASPSASGPP